MDLPKTLESNQAGSKTGRPAGTEPGTKPPIEPATESGEKDRGLLAGSTESCQQQHSPPREEPSFVPEEDIPHDGPDPEGQKMIEELTTGKALDEASGSPPPRPGE